MSEGHDELKMALFAEANQLKKIKINDALTVTIKPLTWQQEMAIAGATANLVKRGAPQEVADREYMKMTVHAGLVEPRMEEKEVEKLKIGIVVMLSSEIGKISGGLQKKESKSSTTEPKKETSSTS